jgi:hypothetical protein
MVVRIAVWGRGDATARRTGRIVAVAVLCAAGLLIPQSAVSGEGGGQSLGSCPDRRRRHHRLRLRLQPGQPDDQPWPDGLLDEHGIHLFTATSDGGVWNSGLLAPGASYRYTFNNAGIYPYHCTPIQRS